MYITSMTTIQEIENQQFIPETEAQMCIAEAGMARLRRRAFVQAEMDRDMARGLFLVVENYPWYCKSTDAVVGEGMTVIHKADSREKAVAWLNASYEAGRIDPESRYVVYPLEVPPATAAAEGTAEDCPF